MPALGDSIRKPDPTNGMAPRLELGKTAIAEPLSAGLLRRQLSPTVPSSLSGFVAPIIPQTRQTSTYPTTVGRHRKKEP